MELGNQRRIWDREYKKRGRLWRGSSIDSIDDEILVPALNNGCGNGKDVNKIDGVLGLDFSINALKLYKLKNKNVVCGNMLVLPFKDRVFRSVLFLHSLDHLLKEERNRAINEAKRVLQKNGLMFIRVFSIKDFRYGKGKEIEENSFVRGNGIITHYFKDDELYFEDFEIIYMKHLIYHLKINGEKKERNEILIKYVLSK